MEKKSSVIYFVGSTISTSFKLALYNCILILILEASTLVLAYWLCSYVAPYISCILLKVLNYSVLIESII